MDPDQNRNRMHAEQHLGRAGVVENGSFIFPMENISTGGAQFAPNWNSAMRSNLYSHPGLIMEVPHHQTATSGSYYGPFPQPPGVVCFCPLPQNHAYGATSSSSSSSSHHRHSIHAAEGIVNPSTGNVRSRPCKRKFSVTSVACERSTTNRDSSAGSSSDLSISSHLQHEKPEPLFQNWPCDTFDNNGVSITAEGSHRNVRSRSTHDLEVNPARTRFSTNPSHHVHFAGRLMDPSHMLDLDSMNANVTARESNHIPMSSASPGRIIASDSHETNQFLIGGSTSNDSAGLGGNSYDLISSRNPTILPQNLHAPPTRGVRRGRGSFSQRPVHDYRPTSSNPHLLYMAASSNDGPQTVSDTPPFRHSRPQPTVVWHNCDRNGRPRMVSYERFRSYSEAAGDANYRLFSEAQGLTIMERSTLYGSRNYLDLHSNMRLDIDSMSYEELLALGERIGNVNTGLSEDLVSMCLEERIYCSSDLVREEDTCAICLEEYKDKEEIGVIKKCGHDYHVGCIKKWLSIKNVCPICKGSALEASLREK